MQSIKFQDGKFEVSLQADGTLHIEAASDASAAELLQFKRYITTHLFAKALIADTLHGNTSEKLPADAQVQFRDERSMLLADGKYEVGKDESGTVMALRYGEPWRQCVGDHMVTALYDYACDLEDAARSTAENLHLIDVALNGINCAQAPGAGDIASQLNRIAGDGKGIPIMDRLQFNSLSAAQAERLFLLLEERAESIQATAKVLRHGYESFHPFRDSGSNREELEKEEGDGCAAMDLLCRAGDLSASNIVEASVKKTQNVKPWLHHQYGTGDEQ
jgi:hypothetical protein